MIRRLAASAFVAACAAHPVCASSGDDLAASYVIAIAGFEIGETTVRLRADERSYDFSFEGGFQFLFWGGAARGQVSGARHENGLTPHRYQLNFDGPEQVIELQIGFSGGKPTNWGVTPSSEPEWLEGRIPIEDAHLPGAVDPFTAFLIAAAAPREACSRDIKVFSGFVRFDLAMRPGATKSDGTIECEVGYSPVSGHRMNSESVARLKRRGLQVSLFEMAEGVWALHRIGLPTSVGTLSFERKR